MYKYNGIHIKTIVYLCVAVLFFLPVNLTCMPTMGRSCRAQGDYAAFEQKDPTQP